MEFREAQTGDLAVLTGLGIRSKATWDYSADQMRVFGEELTWAAELLAQRTVYLAATSRIHGYYSLNPTDERTIDLEHLFVAPEDFGKGIGTKLFNHACGISRQQGYTNLTVMSDPNAAGFYDRVGCQKVKNIPSSIPGRTIPTYRLDLRS